MITKKLLVFSNMLYKSARFISNLKTGNYRMDKINQNQIQNHTTSTPASLTTTDHRQHEGRNPVFPL